MKKIKILSASIFNFFLSAYGVAEQKNYILLTGMATGGGTPPPSGSGIAIGMTPKATMPTPTPTVMPSTGAGIPPVGTPPVSTGSAGGAGYGGGGGGSASAPSGERTGATAPASDPRKSAIMATSGFGVVGLLAGLGFAYTRKSDTKGYIGWGLLGAVALSGIATGFYMAKGTNIFKGTATPPVPTPPPAPTA
jgi:hypothetical protein